MESLPQVKRWNGDNATMGAGALLRGQPPAQHGGGPAPSARPSGFPPIRVPARPSSRQPHSRGKMAQPVLLKDTKLLDVKLGQLPTWLAMRDFTPGGIMGAMQRGYERYYNKYINVKKGGLGGVSMVLAGYVVLSYVWSYSHIKHDRHRKYH